MRPKFFLQNAVGMGQIAVASDSGTLRTLVGSCVSVALFDPKLHLAGLAHVLLPENRIPIVAKACGGEQGRRVSIDVATGSMNVTYTSDPKHLS